MTRANHIEHIAILGGGMGALATAFELTSDPAWQKSRSITIYQQGFRLGGKCASSRRSEANQRIEEHGVHVWMGVYENAFRMIRRCYEELGRTPEQPLSTWQEAFKPQNEFTLEERTEKGWVHWPVRFPANQRLPGDGEPLFLSLPEYVQLALSFVGDGSLGAAREATAALFEAARAIAKAVSQGRLDDAVAEVGRAGAAVAGMGLGSDAARRLRIVFELGSAMVRGVVSDQLLARGFSSIDDEDLVDWLRRHGASSVAVESPIVRGFYDLAIAYAGGDPDRPRIAAGASLRAGLRMLLTTKGSIFYEMQAGMGETVIAPLYEVLARRGVKFEFFHRVEQLRLSDDGRSIEAIDVARQATCKIGAYRPLVDVKGLACWPAQPLFDQLVEGEALSSGKVDLESHWTDWRDVEKVILRRGVDFDRVVLGIPVSALGSVCQELSAARQDWRDLIGKTGSVATQAAQLWLRPDARGLGCQGPKTIVSGYAMPFSVWADLSHLVERECWSTDDKPRSCAYFCGPLKDDRAPPPPSQTDHPAREKSRVRHLLERWLDDNAAHLWPRAASTNELRNALPDEQLHGRPAARGGFDYELLVDAANRRGSERLEAQYIGANINPTDRYIQSLPGTTRYRMKSDQSGYDNLFLAGDWVKTGIDLGCVEAAVMSGFQAARAIAGTTRFLTGENDFRSAPVGGSDLAVRPRAVVTPLRPSLPGTPALKIAVASSPRYVERGGEQTICHPVRFERSRVRAHVLRADGKRLAALCANHFTVPSGGRIKVRPAAPIAILVVAQIGRAASEIEPFRGIGWASEIDVGFWVPVLRSDGDGTRERFAWYHPYLFVDSEYAVASGRESFGFHKMLGTFEIPEDHSDPRPLSVDTMVVHPRGARGVSRRLLDVRRLDEDSGADRSAGDDGKVALDSGLLGRLGALLPGLESSVSRGIAGFEAPMLFLKQFRDIADGRRACYQAIVEAPARLVELRSIGRLPGRYEVEIQPYESHPIARDLGLGSGPQTPLASLQADFDFVMEAGRELWRAGAEVAAVEAVPARCTA